jgi:hypothetical protein
VSGSGDILSVTKTVDISQEGMNYIHYKIIDAAGNIVTGYYGPYKLDKTAPVNFEFEVLNTDENRIKVYGETTDTITSANTIVSEIAAYDFAINNVYQEVYETDGIYTYSGLKPDKSYLLTMKAIDAAGNETETPAVYRRTDEEPVILNIWEVSVTDETTEIIAISKPNSNETSEGADTGEQDEILDQDDTENQSETEAETIEINLSTEEDNIIIGLNAKIVKEMEEENVSLVIENNSATYAIPAKEMYIDTVVEQFGEEIDLDSVAVEIQILTSDEITTQKIEEALASDNYTLVGIPVSFEITCTYEEEIVEISKFTTYVTRTIALSDNVSGSAVTTAVVVMDDYSTYQVPTKVVLIDGIYYAEINSLTNSNYSLIFHEVNYVDIAGHWAEEDIKDMGGRTIIDETNGNAFNPDTSITRGDFIKTIVRALGLKTESGEEIFGDVTASDYYYEYIQVAYDYGLVNGYEDGSCQLENNITREEAMAIINRAMAITGLSTDLDETAIEDFQSLYSDVALISNWALSSVVDCINTGIVQGNTNGTIAPQSNITNAEAVVMIRRLLVESGLI